MLIPVAIIEEGGGGNPSRALIRDEKTSGTASGTATSGAWQTRDLNTEVFDPDGIVSLAANQFTLQAGTYIIEAWAIAWVCNGHQCRIRDITNTATVENGSSEVSSASVFVTNHSKVKCRVVIAAPTTYELQHQVQTTRATDGWGGVAGFAVDSEVYAAVYIEKVV